MKNVLLAIIFVSPCFAGDNVRPQDPQPVHFFVVVGIAAMAINQQEIFGPVVQLPLKQNVQKNYSIKQKHQKGYDARKKMHHVHQPQQRSRR